MNDYTIELMSAAEERGLLVALKAAQADPGRRADYLRLRNEFALRWRPLVTTVLKWWFPAELANGRKADREQDGFLGLLKALDRFDLARGVKFTTYATPWVRQYVARARNNDTLIHTRKHTGKGPDPFAAPRVKAGRFAAGGSDECLGLLAGRAEPDDGPDAAHLAAALEVLTDRERATVTLRFGLTGEGPRTLLDIGRGFGVSKEAVRQFQAKALDKLRKRLEAAGVAA